MVGENAPVFTEEELCRHLDHAYGLRNLRPEWISRQRAFQQNSLVLSICNTDICEISRGSLPWRVQDAHSVWLGVNVLVQIEEVINVAAPDRKSPTPRLLQFALTDGVVNFVAFELDPAKSSLTTDTVPGTKLVLLPSALVRRGRVVLRSEDYTLLGAPQRSMRISGNGDGEPSSVGLARSGESMGSNIGSSSGAHGLNPLASNITDVGGIADIVDPNDEDAGNDNLWSGNPTPSLYPASMRGQTPKFSARGMNANRDEAGFVQRSLSELRVANNTNKAQAGRNSRTGDTYELGRSIAIRSPILDGEQRIRGLQRKDIIASESPRLVRLSHLIDRADSPTVEPAMCRIYAMKTGKGMDYKLMKGSFASTIVDDGTSVQVVTLSNKLISTLRSSFPTRNGEYSQGAEGGLTRYLRSMCGFVEMECQNKVPMAKSLVAEAPVSVSLYAGLVFERDSFPRRLVKSARTLTSIFCLERQSSRLSEFLKEVAERYNNIYATRRQSTWP